MAKAPARPKKVREEEAETLTLGAHDAPGLSPFERMTELTRRLLGVSKTDADKVGAKAKRRSKR